MQKLISDKEQRIDKYLSKELNLTRNKIQKLIKEGHILVNDEKVKQKYICKIDDEIKYEIKEEKKISFIPQKIDIEIIYEDDKIIVVNKKSGMVVHPAVGHPDKTLLNALLGHLKGERQGKPMLVHRIDKDTSGLLLVAKTSEVHRFLQKQLQQRKIKRIYYALVEGVINHNNGTIDAPIGRKRDERKKFTVVSLNSKKAITNFKVLKRFKNHTLVECSLDTGRTHQIRVHFQYIKHPIVNDPVYNRKKNSGFGQLLHAKKLEIIHPETLEKMTFECELPEEFESVLEELEKEE